MNGINRVWKRLRIRMRDCYLKTHFSIKEAAKLLDIPVRSLQSILNRDKLKPYYERRFPTAYIELTEKGKQWSIPVEEVAIYRLKTFVDKELMRMVAKIRK